MNLLKISLSFFFCGLSNNKIVIKQITGMYNLWSPIGLNKIFQTFNISKASKNNLVFYLK